MDFPTPPTRRTLRHTGKINATPPMIPVCTFFSPAQVTPGNNSGENIHPREDGTKVTTFSKAITTPQKSERSNNHFGPYAGSTPSSPSPAEASSKIPYHKAQKDDLKASVNSFLLDKFTTPTKNINSGTVRTLADGTKITTFFHQSIPSADSKGYRMPFFPELTPKSTPDCMIKGFGKTLRRSKKTKISASVDNDTFDQRGSGPDGSFISQGDLTSRLHGASLSGSIVEPVLRTLRRTKGTNKIVSRIGQLNIVNEGTQPEIGTDIFRYNDTPECERWSPSVIGSSLRCEQGGDACRTLFKPHDIQETTGTNSKRCPPRLTRDEGCSNFQRTERMRLSLANKYSSILPETPGTKIITPHQQSLSGGTSPPGVAEADGPVYTIDSYLALCHRNGSEEGIRMPTAGGYEDPNDPTSYYRGEHTQQDIDNDVPTPPSGFSYRPAFYTLLDPHSSFIWTTVRHSMPGPDHTMRGHRYPDELCEVTHHDLPETQSQTSMHSDVDSGCYFSNEPSLTAASTTIPDHLNFDSGFVNQVVSGLGLVTVPGLSQSRGVVQQPLGDSHCQLPLIPSYLYQFVADSDNFNIFEEPVLCPATTGMFIINDCTGSGKPLEDSEEQEEKVKSKRASKWLGLFKHIRKSMGVLKAKASHRLR